MSGRSRVEIPERISDNRIVDIGVALSDYTLLDRRESITGRLVERLLHAATIADGKKGRFVGTFGELDVQLSCSIQRRGLLVIEVN